MKLFFLRNLLLLAVAASTTIEASSTCDASTAYPLDNINTQSPPAGYTGGSGSTGSSGSTGTGGCNAACQSNILQSTQQISGIFASTGAGVAGLSKARVKRKTSTQLPALACSDAEACLSFQGVSFCIDPNTYDFRDEYGGQGNLLTGTYVVPSSVATVSGTPYKAGATITGLGGNQPTGKAKGAVALTGTGSRDTVLSVSGILGFVWFLYHLL